MERKPFKENDEITLFSEGEAERFVLLDRIGSGVISEGYHAVRKSKRGDLHTALTLFSPLCLDFGSDAYLAEKDRFYSLICRREQLFGGCSGPRPAPRFFEDEGGEPWVETFYSYGKTLAAAELEKQSFEAYLNRFTPVFNAVREHHENGLLLLALNPSCVRLCPAPAGEEYAEINDFGCMIDKNVLRDPIRRNRTLISYSKKWSAPEVQKEEYDRISETSDVYSLGLMMYHGLFGKLPQRPWEIRECIEGELAGLREPDSSGEAPISEAVRRVLLNLFGDMLAFEPEQRAGLEVSEMMLGYAMEEIRCELDEGFRRSRLLIDCYLEPEKDRETEL